MDYHCLWFTSTAEFKLWKSIIASFSSPLTHKHYTHLASTELASHCENTAFCIWSEKEYYLTPKAYRDFLALHYKPSLLVIKNKAFAHKAFQQGFSNCIVETELQQGLNEQIGKLLSFYFKPINKRIAFKDKLCIPVDPKKNYYSFIKFENLIRVYQKNKSCYIESIDETLETSIPFLWLKIQCEIPQLQFCPIGKNNLINTKFIKSFGRNKQLFYCELTTEKSLKLNPKQYHILNDYISKNP